MPCIWDIISSKQWWAIWSLETQEQLLIWAKGTVEKQEAPGHIHTQVQAILNPPAVTDLLDWAWGVGCQPGMKRGWPKSVASEVRYLSLVSWVKEKGHVPCPSHSSSKRRDQRLTDFLFFMSSQKRTKFLLAGILQIFLSILLKYFVFYYNL